MAMMMIIIRDLSLKSQPRALESLSIYLDVKLDEFDEQHHNA